MHNLDTDMIQFYQKVVSLVQVNSNNLPRALYHYTDLNALKGILTNNELWATNCMFLNDSKELSHGVQLTIDELDNTARQSKVFGLVFDKLKELFWGLEQFAAELNIGVCSFSEERDSLSLWRGYGNGSSSVSIGFDQSKLHHSNNKRDSFTILGKIIYDAGEQRTIIRKMLLLAENFWFGEKFGLYSLAMPILFTLLFFKEERWNEENEWRLVVLPESDFAIQDFRASQHSLIPFYKQKIFNNSLASKAISEIILPKSDYFRRNKTAIKLFNKDLETKITESRISINHDMR